MPDGSNDTWLYDTSDNHLISNTFGEINPHSDITTDSEIVPNIENGDIVKKIAIIESLEIILGTNCNFTCKICPQTAKKELFHSSSPKDVDRFIELLTIAKEQGLSPKHIRYWGGEPLVYWKTLKHLIPKIHGLFGKNVVVSLTSNGSLLTREMVDLFTEYGIHLNISHDGGDIGNRDWDVLNNEKTKEVIEYAQDKMGNNFAFMTTLMKGTSNLYNKFDYFDKKTPKQFKISVVEYRYNEMNKGVSERFSSDDKTDVTKGVYNALTCEEIKNRLTHISTRYFANRLITRSSIDQAIYDNCNQSTVLTVDLSGNVFSCKIRTQNIGNLTNLQDYISHDNIGWKNRKNCPTCPLIHVCGGGCVRQSEWEHEFTCEDSFYPISLGIFKATFKELFNVDIVGITPHE